jgi:hypothetical protein
MVTPLEELFPGLAGGAYRITSPPARDYNCIAWAAGDAARWWWPGPNLREEYWPPGIPREPTLSAFQEAFGLLGYRLCESDDLEPGFEKIALFADAQGRPTHAARQLLDGSWTSKLGKREDIEHRLRDLTGAIYDSVVRVFRRAVSSGSQG